MTVADLDLSRDRDVEIAERRVHAAIEQICSAGRVMSLPETPAARECRKTAEAQAEVQLASLREGRRLASR